MNNPFTINGNRPAARIQKAFLSVDREGKEPDEWQLEQLLAAWVATSVESANRSGPEIMMGEIIRADRTASGHIDWRSKFALYCEDLAMGRKINP